jgi:hypothetical protein
MVGFTPKLVESAPELIAIAQPFGVTPSSDRLAALRSGLCRPG